MKKCNIVDNRNDFFKVLNLSVDGNCFGQRPALSDKQFDAFTLLTDLCTYINDGMLSVNMAPLDTYTIIAAGQIVLDNELIDLSNAVAEYIDRAYTSPTLGVKDRDMVKTLMTVFANMQPMRNSPMFIRTIVECLRHKFGVERNFVWLKQGDVYAMLINNSKLVFFKPDMSVTNNISGAEGLISVYDVGSYIGNYLSFGKLGLKHSTLPHRMGVETMGVQKSRVTTVRLLETNQTGVWSAKIGIKYSGWWGIQGFSFTNTCSRLGQRINKATVMESEDLNLLLGTRGK